MLKVALQDEILPGHFALISKLKCDFIYFKNFWTIQGNGKFFMQSHRYGCNS